MTRPSHRDLDALTDAVRRESIPSVDWARVESELLESVEHSRPSGYRARARPRFRTPLFVAVAAAAAAIAAFVSFDSLDRTVDEQGRAADRGLPASESSSRDGRHLFGQTVVAESRSVRIRHRGDATWTLQPSSRARLREQGRAIVVDLERGALLAEVVPSNSPESFIVVASGIQVAVHGTVFRVELKADSVAVEVREGTVAVRRVDGVGGQTELIAPARALFTPPVHQIEGPELSPTSKKRASARSPSIPSTQASASAEAEPSAPLPVRPDAEAVERGFVAVSQHVRDCFVEQHGAGGVYVSVSTELELSIRPDGAISTATFRPPIAPRVESCVDERIAAVEFPPSVEGAQVRHPILLER